jgi:hypothetical protein
MNSEQITINNILGCKLFIVICYLFIGKLMTVSLGAKVRRFICLFVKKYWNFFWKNGLFLENFIFFQI